MADVEDRNIDLVRTYLNALQSGEAGDALRRFFTHDVQQVEMPNLIVDPESCSIARLCYSEL